MQAAAIPRSTALLDQLLGSAQSLWRGRGQVPQQENCASGHAALDQALPGGGLPLGALTELLLPQFCLGELSLLLPLLQKLSQNNERIALIAPPLLLNAAALAAHKVALGQLLLVQLAPNAGADIAWAGEQLLRSGCFKLVLIWQTQIEERSLKRLQLAAESGHSLALLCRQASALHSLSPAALRLGVRPDLQSDTPIELPNAKISQLFKPVSALPSAGADSPKLAGLRSNFRAGLRVDIHKCRGYAAQRSVRVALPWH